MSGDPLRGMMRLFLTILLVAAGAGHAPHATLMWLDHGPLNLNGYYLDAAWDPSGEDGGSWYVAAYGSGIYHTRDAGDTYQLAGLQGPVTTVAAPWGRLGRVYAGTGRNLWLDYWRFYPIKIPAPVPGSGLYYSDDFGTTWQLTGFPRQPGTDLDYISQVITAAAGDSVLAATYRRIFRSADGGRSFEEAVTLVEDESYHSTYFIDLVAHPRHFRVQYALLRDYLSWGVIGRVRTAGTVGVLRSADGGANWDTLRIGEWPVAGYRVGIGIAPSSPAVHWMIVDDGDWGRAPAGYRSTDSGETWQEVNMPDPSESQFGKGNTPDYLHVHPWQPDTLLFDGSYAAYHAASNSLELGGLAFGNLQWSEYDRARALMAGDGPLPAPVTYSGNVLQFHVTDTWRGHLRRDSWFHRDGRLLDLGEQDFGGTPGLSTAHIWDVCKHPRIPGTGADYRFTVTSGIYGALRSSSAPRLNQQWARGQEQFGIHHPHTAILCHATDLHLTLRALAGSRWWDASDPSIWRSVGPVASADDWEDVPDLRGILVAALSASVQDPDLVYAATWNGVYRSADFGLTWTQLSEVNNQDLRPNAVEVSKADDQVIWTDKEVSRDGGQTWQPWQVPEPDRLVTHHSDPSVVFVCRGELTRYDNWGAAHTRLGGPEDWGGLGCNDAIVFPYDINWMWVGTSGGLWETMDGGDTWQQAHRGLPPVGINRIFLGDTRIVLATQGRGVQSVSRAEVEALRTGTARAPDIHQELFRLGANYPNPFRRRTSFDVHLERPARIRLEVFDLAGRQVAVLTHRAYKAGAHRVQWQAGDRASGVYFVRMTADDRQIKILRLVLAR